MSKNQIKAKGNGVPKKFCGPNTKDVVHQLLKAYQAGELEDLSEHVVIQVSGGNLSPEAERFFREKPV